jgi:hypothetical protein
MGVLSTKVLPYLILLAFFVTLSSGFLNTSGSEYRKVAPAGHTSPDKEFSFLRLKLYQRTFL